MAVVASAPQRDEVWLVSLDPTQGAEIQKTRPCLVVSPDEVNRNLRTVIVAPMTTAIRSYPTRVLVRFQGKRGQVALDQLRSIDQQRLIKKLGTLASNSAQLTSTTLVEMFSRV
jgi:mRNA interferase MazF